MSGDVREVRVGRLSPPQLTLLAAAVAVAVTVAVSLFPFLEFAYRAPELHVALETTASIVALLVGFLLYGRVRATRRLSDLLVALSLGTVAAASLLLTTLPRVLLRGAELSQWGPVGVRMLGTVLLAAGAVVPASVLVRRIGRPVALVAAGVLLVVVAVVALESRLPLAVDPALVEVDSTRPLVVGHPVLLGMQAVGAALYGLAAVLFTRRAGRTGDQMLGWIGAGCAFAAGARVNYLLFPSLYTDLVYVGDLLRFVFYVFLAIGAAREIQAYWGLRAEAAVLEERRRMARDLHDGLTQELSYIYSQSRLASRNGGDAEATERVAGAAGRALDEARRAIAALTRPVDEPFGVVLEAYVEDLCQRYDAALRADVEPVDDLTLEQCQVLLRITAEAVRNAVVHGKATVVEVRLRADPLTLRVVDNGYGFDPAERRSRGFGLISMAERAAGLGGTCRIDSAAGCGTTVTATFP